MGSRIPIAKGDPWLGALLLVIVPALVALASFFSWIMLINDLRIPFYLYYGRTVFLIYIDRFFDKTIWILASILTLVLVAARPISRSISFRLSILFLSLGIALGTVTTLGVGQGIPIAGPLATFAGCVVAVFVEIRQRPRASRRHFAVVLLLALSLLVLPAEAGSLLYFVLSAFDAGIETCRPWMLLELQIWYTAFPLIPLLYVAFLFSWIWAPLSAKMLSRSTRYENAAEAAKTRAKSRRRTAHVDQDDVSGRDMTAKDGSEWLIAIGAYVLLAFFLGYYAYFHDASYPLVGTDIYWRNALPAERVLSSSSWIDAAARERHPLVVLGIAFASSFLGLGVESILRFAYVGLILAFGAAVFLLVLVGSGSRGLASFSALLSTVSATTTAGIYTGIVANWVALIVWTLSLTALAVGKEYGPRRYVVVIAGLGFGSLLVLFIHPWTWIVLIVGLVAYSLIVAVLRLKDGLRDIGSVLLVILFNAGALALSLLALSRTQGWRIYDAFSMIQASLGAKYFGLGSWQIVVFFSQIWSQFLHPMLLILSVLGALVLARRRDRFAVIVLAWIVAASAANVLAAPIGYDPMAVTRGETQIFRAMFLTPFQIPAAVGLLFVKSTIADKIGQIAGPRIAMVVVGTVLGVVFLGMLNGALRALFPLLTDPHNYPWPLEP